MGSHSYDNRQDAIATPIIVDGVLHAKTVSAVSLAWAGLLVYKDWHDSRMELTPLLCAISKQFALTNLWTTHGIPTIFEADAHHEFVKRVCDKFRPSSAMSGPAAVVEMVPRFMGSEWQRPKRGGEVEILLLITYWLAMLIDTLLGREFRVV